MSSQSNNTYIVSKNAKQSRLRSCCFTVNTKLAEWQDETIKTICSNFQSKCDDEINHVKYMIIGFEVGDESKIPHLQGYIAFDKQMQFNKIKEFIGDNTCHIEKARGKAEQNKTYCSKSGNFWEWGSLPKAGKRNDLEEIKQAILVDKKSINDVVVNLVSNQQQLRFAEGLCKYISLDNTFKKKQVIWIHGTTGTGKSRYAHELDPNLWTWNGGLQWFDGYFGQKTALLEDFRDTVAYNYLLQLLDGYQIRVPVKGGYTVWNPDTIIITSVFAPHECFRSNDRVDTIGQLLRRITRIVNSDEELVSKYAEEDSLKNQEISQVLTSEPSEVGGNTIPRPLYSQSEIEDLDNEFKRAKKRAIEERSSQYYSNDNIVKRVKTLEISSGIMGFEEKPKSISDFIIDSEDDSMDNDEIERRITKYKAMHDALKEKLTYREREGKVDDECCNNLISEISRYREKIKRYESYLQY